MPVWGDFGDFGVFGLFFLIVSGRAREPARLRDRDLDLELDLDLGPRSRLVVSLGDFGDFCDLLLARDLGDFADFADFGDLAPAGDLDGGRCLDFCDVLLPPPFDFAPRGDLDGRCVIVEESSLVCDLLLSCLTRLRDSVLFFDLGARLEAITIVFTLNTKLGFSFQLTITIHHDIDADDNHIADR